MRKQIDAIEDPLVFALEHTDKLHDREGQKAIIDYSDNFLANIVRTIL
jgi:hypothetical protein